MGMFDSSKVFTTYHASITFRNLVLGGVPKNPKAIEGWLRSKAGIDKREEIYEAARRTLLELGVKDLPENATYEEMVKASKLLANANSVGFKVGEQGCYLEGRQVKACLKECVNILFPGERWGARAGKPKLSAREKKAQGAAAEAADLPDVTFEPAADLPEEPIVVLGSNADRPYQGKGPKNLTAERVFVWQDQLWLGTPEPTGLELIVGHINDPSGTTRATLTNHESCYRSTVEFDVMVARDTITAAQWEEIWVQAQEIGLGAVRSQGYGRFDIWQWHQVPTPQFREQPTTAAHNGAVLVGAA